MKHNFMGSAFCMSVASLSVANRLRCAGCVAARALVIFSVDFVTLIIVA